MSFKRQSVMRKVYVLIFFFAFNVQCFKSQNLYFPPIIGNSWDTLSPQALNWCQPRIDSLYNYLQAKNTKSFIVLKNGKIVLEKYFGTYTADSSFYWASVGKSLTAFLVGLAQQKGLININNKVSQYIGTGWSSAPLIKENLITVKNLLQMTSGLNDSPMLPCTNEDTAKSCLTYLADAGTRWAYHTGAYKKNQDVISNAAGLSYNSLTTSWVKTKIGMDGFWFNQVYYSKARGMARYGLLILNKGVWVNDTLMKDTVYFKNMVNTSQNLNQAYGYLWWLNGKSTLMVPGSQIVLPGYLIPNAPADLFAALGKNDQKIYIVPSKKLVVIRQGNSAENVASALSNFDNNLWDFINKLNCESMSLKELELASQINVFPNPANNKINIETSLGITSALITDGLGCSTQIKLINHTADISCLSKGFYNLTIITESGLRCNKKLIIN
jgi:CubicO group peptidase (beta-lactamase class C family)